jgi:meiotically up-regulated gene 157 (Mug157) protein
VLFTLYKGCNPSIPASLLQKYGYNIPANMYAAGALRRLLMLNQAVWGSEEVTDRVLQLLKDIHEGLEKWGMTKAPDGSTVYAYEVGRSPARAPVA